MTTTENLIYTCKASGSQGANKFELKERHYGRSFDLVTLIKYAKEGKQFYCKTPPSPGLFTIKTHYFRWRLFP